MKKTIISTILLVAVIFASAQQTAGAPAATKNLTAKEQAKNQADVLDQTLTLTVAQKEKVNAICLTYYTAREQYSSLNKEEFLAKMKPVQEQGEAKLNALLNKEQQKKYADYKNSMKKN